MILVISLTCSTEGDENQKLLNTFVKKLKMSYYHNKLVIFNTVCIDDSTVLRTHQYHQIQLLDLITPMNLEFYNFYQQPTFVFAINDLSTAEVFLDRIIKNFYLGYDFPRSTVVYSPDRKNFVADFSAFNKIVVWNDFKQHHVRHIELPTHPLTKIVDFDWDKLEEYFWFLFLKDRMINYLELID